MLFTASSSSSRPISLLPRHLQRLRHRRHGAPPASFSSSSSAGRRPKKKIYHREPDLDKVMDLQKKPALILRLRELIVGRRHGSPLLLRDLEKEVGFVQKWDFISLIQKQPSIFRVAGGVGAAVSVRLTERAERASAGEAEARALMEPILVTALRKLLMMSMDCQVPMAKIELIQSELGLPSDFQRSLIPKYPSLFSVREINGAGFLCLESWDSSLAVTNREEKLAHGGAVAAPLPKRAIPRDGNYPGPFSFKLAYPPGFRPNKGYLEEVVKWQKLPFPSPYLNGRSFDPAAPPARKRAVAVLHELLSLTMEKRMNSEKLDAFHDEYQLPCKLLLCLVKNHGIFYITNKGARSTVFLKEAYQGRHLREKCPLLSFYDRFLALSGRSYLESPDINPI
ncbi:unnamed protein product [Spirodela intermedia]|uniref:PORR domain-containing protein n=1 Tax=Spirodela intermedia TaxID=51605 RepID=A0A7I8KAE9_SPIIN|nr:unnamed protein product [Spirodela intermedia]